LYPNLENKNSIFLKEGLQMLFLKFKILQTKEEHSVETNLVNILFNTNHIVSIKPIKIVLDDSILNGFWIRLTNGKKYKATEIPLGLKDLLTETKKEDLGLELSPQVH
jgi:hypothetical protein